MNPNNAAERWKEGMKRFIESQISPVPKKKIIKSTDLKLKKIEFNFDSTEVKEILLIFSNESNDEIRIIYDIETGDAKAAFPFNYKVEIDKAVISRIDKELKNAELTIKNEIKKVYQKLMERAMK